MIFVYKYNIWIVINQSVNTQKFHVETTILESNTWTKVNLTQI